MLKTMLQILSQAEDASLSGWTTKQVAGQCHCQNFMFYVVLPTTTFQLKLQTMAWLYELKFIDSVAEKQ